MGPPSRSRHSFTRCGMLSIIRRTSPRAAMAEQIDLKRSMASNSLCGNPSAPDVRARRPQRLGRGFRCRCRHATPSLHCYLSPFDQWRRTPSRRTGNGNRERGPPRRGRKSAEKCLKRPQKWAVSVLFALGCARLTRDAQKDGKLLKLTLGNPNPGETPRANENIVKF